MGFAATLQADIAGVASPDEFAEELLYRPGTGSSFAIRALVSRHPLMTNPAAKQSQQSTFELVIPKAGDYGLSAVVKGVDKVDVPPTRGAAAVTMRVVEVLAEGLGSWKLKVRA